MLNVLLELLDLQMSMLKLFVKLLHYEVLGLNLFTETVNFFLSAVLKSLVFFSQGRDDATLIFIGLFGLKDLL